MTSTLRFSIGITSKENLFKVDAERSRLEQVESHLWHGQVDAALAVFAQDSDKAARNFCAYLQTHYQRLINLKLSGAQWKRENINQMLRLRCAYLNQT
jgi:hypothetical protein